MGMDRAAGHARVGPDETSSSEAGLTLAALIDVLDRADAVPARPRPRPRRGAIHRSPSARTVADRWDPLRDSGSRPTATARRPGGSSRAATPPSGTDRLVPRVVQARTVPLRSVPPAPPARLPVVLAGGPVPAPAVPARTRVPVGARLRAVLAAVVRRAALWGAGPGGSHLAWGAPAPARVFRAGATGTPAPPRRADAPVVLRELPSTPTARPAPRDARPPAPAGPAVRSAPVRSAPVRAPRTPALSTVRRVAPLPAASAGVPSRARSPGGVRGSPGSARGSPPWEPDPG